VAAGQEKVKLTGTPIASFAGFKTEAVREGVVVITVVVVAGVVVRKGVVAITVVVDITDVVVDGLDVVGIGSGVVVVVGIIVIGNLVILSLPVLATQILVPSKQISWGLVPTL
jgi:hypothetical protein